MANQKQELPVAAMLSMDQDKMSNLHRWPSIDASYQVSVHLAVRFQRRRLKCEKLTDDGRQVMAKAHFAFGIYTQSINHTNALLIFKKNNNYKINRSKCVLFEIFIHFCQLFKFIAHNIFLWQNKTLANFSYFTKC